MVNTEIRLIIFFAAKDGDALYSQQKQDQELTVAQIISFHSKISDLNKAEKTTRPARYDLNQIPYEFAVEVMNRFKGLDLVNKVDNYGWRPMILHRKQQAKSRQRKRKARRQSGCLRRLYK